MKTIILIFILIVFSVSGCIMQTPDKFENKKHPEPCFQNALSFDKCAGKYAAPLPSDYASAVLPSGLPISLSFPLNYPLNIRLSSPVDEKTLKDGLFVLKVGNGVYEKVEDSKYMFKFGELNTSTFQFSDDKTFLNIIPVDDAGIPSKWEEGYTYIVVMTKELQDINGDKYASPAAFFMASSTFDITPDIVKALDPTMSDAEATATVQVLLGMRAELDAPYQLIDMLLHKTKFDVTFLWTFTFNNQTVCFQSTDIKNCEETPLPLPSDLMSMALPQNTNLNISQKDKFSINFSDDVNLQSFISNLVIIKKSLTRQDTPEVISPSDLVVEFDGKNHKKLLISNKDGKWDSGYSYIIYLKKGINSSSNVEFLPSLAFFFSTLKEPLISSEGKILSSIDDLFDANKPEDIALLKSLEGLRLFNDPLITLAETLGILQRKDLLMIWTATIPEDIIIPCFNSSSVAGCENADAAPLPSDFIMAYNEDGTHHLDLPIPDDSSDMMKGILGAINTLDGWSTTKGFNLTLSGNIDSSTLSTDYTSNPALMVLKIADKNGPLVAPQPVGVIASFNGDWKQLKINPIMRKWDESSTYLVVLTNGVTGVTGEKLVKPITFSLMSEEESLVNKDTDGNIISSKYAALSTEEATALEAARVSFLPAYSGLATMGITRDNVAMMWTVTTQSITKEMQDMRNFVSANPAFPTYMELDPSKTISNPAFSTVFSGIDLTNVSVIAYGKFKAPIFLSDLSSPYMGAFDPNKFPANGGTTPPRVNAQIEKLPFLVAFPKPAEGAVKPVATNKIIIFQHGFTRSKEDVLPLLNTLTGEGYIVIAYDMPFHGERTVDQTDNFSNRRGEAGADGIPDKSGDGFISLNPFASRDNIRQSVLEQVELIKTLKTIDFSAIDTTNQIEYSTINPNEIYYIGHSLGTMVGNILFSVEDSIKAAVLNAAGANFTKLLMSTSEDIKTPIIEQLKTLGLEEGTAKFEQFLYLAQTAVERGESLNFKRDNTDNLLIQEAIEDPVIINSITRDLGVVEGSVNHLDATIIKPNNYKSYFVNAYSEYVHSFLFLNTSATEEARTDIINFFENVQ